MTLVFTVKLDHVCCNAKAVPTSLKLISMRNLLKVWGRHAARSTCSRVPQTSVTPYFILLLTPRVNFQKHKRSSVVAPWRPQEASFAFALLLLSSPIALLPRRQGLHSFHVQPSSEILTVKKGTDHVEKFDALHTYNFISIFISY